LRSGQTVEVTVDGSPVLLAPDDVLVTTEHASDWRCAEEGGIQIALSTVLTPELIGEGIARDFVRQVQQLRKDADLEITDRIRVDYSTDDDTVAAAIKPWHEYIARETLADRIERRETPAAGVKPVSVGEGKVSIWIERV
jgi:isoleucyl-tRNA synthetase